MAYRCDDEGGGLEIRDQADQTFPLNKPGFGNKYDVWMVR